MLLIEGVRVGTAGEIPVPLRTQTDLHSHFYCNSCHDCATALRTPLKSMKYRYGYGYHHLPGQILVDHSYDD